MGVIRVLTDQVANQIAAGEVVERPASVVKELLENALDAGATHIRVEADGGGRARLRVTDNGCGMVRDDALLALERHATSKLRDIHGLNAIATLGFRGEALPSIAAVSRFTLETSTGAGGVRLIVDAGRLQSVQEAGLPRGTAITVERLFYNLPARRKFLKSEATELGHITTLVTHYALAYPEIHFHLETPHRTLLALTPVTASVDRLGQVFGPDTVAQLVEFRELAGWPAEADAGAAANPAGDETLPGLGLHGFASRPEFQKLNRDSIFTFVNRRLVRDRVLQHALSAAYANLLPKHAFPAVLLFLDLPFSEVDVNVHPAKTELRFRRQTFIHDAVRDGIRNALGLQRPVPSFLRERYAHPTARPAWTPARSEPAAAAKADDGGGLGITPADLPNDLPAGFHLQTAPPAPPAPVAQPLPLAPPARGSEAWVPETRSGCAPGEAAAPSSAQSDELEHLRPLGQIEDSYIVAAGPSGLWLVDQHAAHERVLFERIAARCEAGPAESQGLLLPLIVELEPGRFEAFADLAEELRRMGFAAEVFGGRSVAVQAAPAGIPGEHIEALLRELLEVAAPEQRGLSLETLRTRIAATIACHAAIKVHMRLEPAKMTWLLGALARTRYPMTCPHGRPVLLRYGLDEIQRAFKRIR